MAKIKKITGEIIISPAIANNIKKEIKNISDFKKKIEENLSKRVTDLITIVLTGAFYLDASDIHIEPEKKQVKFRLRIDGVLHNVLTFDITTYKDILSLSRV